MSKSKKAQPPRFNLGCSDEQRAVWQAAADKSGRTLSNWCRFVLDLAAERVLNDQPPDDETLAAERRRVQQAAETLRAALDALPADLREQIIKN